MYISMSQSFYKWVALCVLFSSILVFCLFSQGSATGGHERSVWIWTETNIDTDVYDHLYVYQGYVDSKGTQSRFFKRGPNPYQTNRKVTIVLRLRGLSEVERVANTFLNLINDWEGEDNQVVGIQIDYDSPTAKLGEYATYLKKIKEKLPPKYSLNITGLCDWILNGHRNHFSSIYASADEIAFQLYQGRKPIGFRNKYLHKLESFKFPYKIGIAYADESSQKLALKTKNNKFNGIILFKNY